MLDLLIIGGGVNGAGIARDAAGRGLSVMLCEKDDLAEHTSSSSTKLIHGGLRYLEHFEFRLVREALIEREVLMRSAPHIIWPLRFILPYDSGLRPAWLLRLGLFVYDHLGGRKLLPATKRVGLPLKGEKRVLQDRLKFGFEYSDCWVDDARLVVLNAMDAAERGAKVVTQTECTSLRRSGNVWRAKLLSKDGSRQDLSAKVVVNAAGPWVDNILHQIEPTGDHAKAKLVKGSHLITRRLYEGEKCYIFQNPDNRIIFAIPYETEYTLIGTTDESFDGDPSKVEASTKEIEYLINAANEYFERPISSNDIIGTYAGVRPLYNDQSQNNSTTTRDYVFEISDAGDAILLSIFGGKITTYRKLAEHALAKLSDHIEISSRAWTDDAMLQGGDIPEGNVTRYIEEQSAKYSWIPQDLVSRYVRCYGTRCSNLIGQAKTLNDLGLHFGAGLYEAEAIYLTENEFATKADDILWRRTKLGLHMSVAERRTFQKWFEDK